jgi:hypothetical protein
MRLRHDEDSVVRILVDGQRGSNPQVLVTLIGNHLEFWYGYMPGMLTPLARRATRSAGVAEAWS